MDFDAFAARLTELRPRLYRTARLYLGSEAMALDAVDEAVYKGLKHLKSLRQPDYFDTWLTRILINECKQELRRRGREQVEAPPEQAAQDFDALPLKEAVQRLPQELREVVILRYFSDLTLAQTAQVLGLAPGTVSTRQRRALQLLRLTFLPEEGRIFDES